MSTEESSVQDDTMLDGPVVVFYYIGAKGKASHSKAVLNPGTIIEGCREFTLAYGQHATTGDRLVLSWGAGMWVDVTDLQHHWRS